MPSTVIVLKSQLVVSTVTVLPLATVRSVVPSATTFTMQDMEAVALLKMSAEIDNFTLPRPRPMMLSVVLSRESTAALDVAAVFHSSV